MDWHTSRVGAQREEPEVLGSCTEHRSGHYGQFPRVDKFLQLPGLQRIESWRSPIMQNFFKYCTEGSGKKKLDEGCSSRSTRVNFLNSVSSVTAVRQVIIISGRSTNNSIWRCSGSYHV